MTIITTTLNNRKAYVTGATQAASGHYLLSTGYNEAEAKDFGTPEKAAHIAAHAINPFDRKYRIQTISKAPKPPQNHQKDRRIA